MPRVDEIDDSNVDLVVMLAVKTANVLLQGPPPRNGQGQHQRVQWRMVETFADEFARCQENTRRHWRQLVELRDDRRPLLSGHSSVQHEYGRELFLKGTLRIASRVVCTLGQYKHLAALPVGLAGFRDNTFRAPTVVRQAAKNILNPRLRRDVNRSVVDVRYDLQHVGRTCRIRRLVANRPALHEDDGLLTIATDRSCRQPKHVFRLHAFQYGVERNAPT